MCQKLKLRQSVNLLGGQLHIPRPAKRLQMMVPKIVQECFINKYKSLKSFYAKENYTCRMDQCGLFLELDVNVLYFWTNKSFWEHRTQQDCRVYRPYTIIFLILF